MGVSVSCTGNTNDSETLSQFRPWYVNTYVCMYVAGPLSMSVVLRNVLANPKSDVRSFTLTGVLVLL